MESSWPEPNGPFTSCSGQLGNSAVKLTSRSRFCLPAVLRFGFHWIEFWKVSTGRMSSPELQMAMLSPDNSGAPQPAALAQVHQKVTAGAVWWLSSTQFPSTLCRIKYMLCLPVWGKEHANTSTVERLKLIWEKQLIVGSPSSEDYSYHNQTMPETSGSCTTFESKNPSYRCMFFSRSCLSLEL